MVDEKGEVESIPQTTGGQFSVLRFFLEEKTCKKKSETDVTCDLVPPGALFFHQFFNGCLLISNYFPTKDL